MSYYNYDTASLAYDSSTWKHPQQHQPDPVKHTHVGHSSHATPATPATHGYNYNPAGSTFAAYAAEGSSYGISAITGTTGISANVGNVGNVGNVESVGNGGEGTLRYSNAYAADAADEGGTTTALGISTNVAGALGVAGALPAANAASASNAIQSTNAASAVDATTLDATDATAAATAPATLAISPPTDEESQTVPESLDHLTRDELCHMIYRLDYERHTLKGQLEGLRSLLDQMERREKELPRKEGESRGKRKQSGQSGLSEQSDDSNIGRDGTSSGQTDSTRTAQTTRTAMTKGNKRARTSNAVLHPQHRSQPSQRQKQQKQQQKQQQQKQQQQRNGNKSSRSRIQSTPEEAEEMEQQQQQQQQQHLQQQILQLQKRIGKNTISAIKSANHGGRKVPKTNIWEGNVSLDVVEGWIGMGVENGSERRGRLGRTNAEDGGDDEDGGRSQEDLVVNDTKRMKKWNLTSDWDISGVLGCERLIHPVKHDGSGYIMAIGGNVSKIYNWAKFLSMEIRYDRRDSTLQLRVRTTCAGGGRPEFVPEKVKYSKGEREDFPGLMGDGW